MASYVVARHSDACRERMERLVSQDLLGADLVVRIQTRHEEAFSKHLEEHDGSEKKMASHSQHTHQTTHDQQSSSSLSGSGANRDNRSAQNRQRSHVSEHEQDVDMDNEGKGKT